MSKLRILQIGAGSMGTRRLRDLSKRDDVVLAVYDLRSNRRTDAAATFRIPAFASLEEALAWQPHALCISTPPDGHAPFVELALERGLHHFCEANIWTPNWRQVERESSDKHLVSAPSCTFHFHPMVAELKRLVRKPLGKLHAWQYCLSTYLHDWHPGEGDEFYARHRGTTAAREMVPFELLWLNEVFGPPQQLSGTLEEHAALGNGKELEDGWYLQLKLDHGAIGQLSVLMGCPTVMRKGVCFGDRGLIEFDLWHGVLHYRLQELGELTLEFGGQSDLIEDVYRQEINAFVEAIHGKSRWPLSYREANVATTTLAAAELSALSAVREKVDPDRQPARLPTDYEVRQHDLDMTSRHGLGRPIHVRNAPEPEPL